jgi:hypothetical protein
METWSNIFSYMKLFINFVSIIVNSNNLILYAKYPSLRNGFFLNFIYISVWDIFISM